MVTPSFKTFSKASHWVKNLVLPLQAVFFDRQIGRPSFKTILPNICLDSLVMIWKPWLPCDSSLNLKIIRAGALHYPSIVMKVGISTHLVR